jgi:hypothetical protein
MTDHLIALDGFLDIQADAEGGREPYLGAEPAYSGGFLDVDWTYNDERLPVVVDLETLNAEIGIPVVLGHDEKKPVGVIQSITQSKKDLGFSGIITYPETEYVQNEIKAAKRGFRHRPSITVRLTENSRVVRVDKNERRFVNQRWFDRPCFVVYGGQLRNISIVTTPGDINSDKTGVIKAEGDSIMNDKPITPVGPMDGSADDKTKGTLVSPVQPSGSEPISTDIVQDLQAAGAPTQVQKAIHPSYSGIIEKMYERGEIGADIMANAIEFNWSPKTALTAQEAIKKATGGTGNVAGYPQPVVKPSGNDRKEPNGDFIMASAYLQNHCQFSPDDCKKYLKVDDRTLDASTLSRYRQVRLSDICAHVVQTYHESQKNDMGRINDMQRRPYELFCEAVRVEGLLEATGKLPFETSDIRADADTGVSTIGLKHIWTLINTATIDKGYDSVSSNWQRICGRASVTNFLKHTKHRTNMLGRFQRLSQIGGEPPHATFSESMFDSKIDSWGIMVAFTRQDIINDELGIFNNMAFELGKVASKTLEEECWIALLQLDSKIFTSAHHNLLTGNDSVFSFKALDNATTLFGKQKDPDGRPIMVRPAFLVVPQAIGISVSDLLSMGTKDGSDKGVVNNYQRLSNGIVETPFLNVDNGLYTEVGSNVQAVPGSDTAWYLFASPSEMAVITATFLNGKERPTIERGNMRFTLDGVQYKAIMDFEFNGNEFRGAVKAKGV